MELLKQLLAMKQVNESTDVKSLILEAVKRTLNVRGAQGADPFVDGNTVTWGVRYDFPEHGDGIEQEINDVVQPIGTATFEMVNGDEDDEGNFRGVEAIYEATITLANELTDAEAKDLEDTISELVNE